MAGQGNLRHCTHVEVVSDPSLLLVLPSAANLTLPEGGEGQCFESVEFVEEEPDKEGREKLVEQYRKEGRDALPPPDKRFRRDSKLFTTIFMISWDGNANKIVTLIQDL